jgi:hypothetical protein
MRDKLVDIISYAICHQNNIYEAEIFLELADGVGEMIRLAPHSGREKIEALLGLASFLALDGVHPDDLFGSFG